MELLLLLTAFLASLTGGQADRGVRQVQGVAVVHAAVAAQAAVQPARQAIPAVAVQPALEPERSAMPLPAVAPVRPGRAAPERMLE